MADFGYTFQPGGGNGRMTGTDGSGAGGNVSPQEAIRILSFRVPKQPMAGAIAPQALLPGATQQASQSASLNTIVSALMQAIKPSRTSTAQMPAMGGGGGMSSQQNISFNTGGGIGPVVPPGTFQYPTPTFTPGGDATNRPSVTDLFGNDVSREGGGGMKEVTATGDGSYSDWVNKENALNDRQPIDYTQDLFRF